MMWVDQADLKGSFARCQSVDGSPRSGRHDLTQPGDLRVGRPPWPSATVSRVSSPVTVKVVVVAAWIPVVGTRTVEWPVPSLSCRRGGATGRVFSAPDAVTRQ